MRLSTLLIFLLAYTLPSTALSQAYLADLPSGFGPFDYTDYSDPEQRRKNLWVVEKYHFDEGVRNLQRGMTGSVWGDLNYTLRAFPNHHIALEAMARLLRVKDTHMSPELYDARYRAMPIDVTIDAYFKKATRFAPRDGVVWLLYGIHLHKSDNKEEALKAYSKAEELLPGSADVQYDLGLLYTEMGDYQKAYEHAKKAYGLGHPLPGLRRRLMSAGVWKADPG